MHADAHLLRYRLPAIRTLHSVLDDGVSGQQAVKLCETIQYEAKAHKRERLVEEDASSVPHEYPAYLSYDTSNSPVGHCDRTVFRSLLQSVVSFVAVWPFAQNPKLLRKIAMRHERQEGNWGE